MNAHAPQARPPDSAIGAEVQAESHAVLNHHAKSFSLAGVFLPPKQADDAAVVYAFCRLVDDLADEAPNPTVARKRLDAVSAELDGDAVPRPIVAAFLTVAERQGIDLQAARDLMAGVLSDLVAVRVRDVEELDLYCYRVAGTVGIMMCGVMGVTNATARAPALALGEAMQLTNICRDVLEDLDRDRVYVPQTLLVQQGTSQAELLAGSADRQAVVSAVSALLDRAEDKYDQALAGMGFIPFRPRLAILVARRLYRQIGRRLRHLHGGDPLHGRTMVPNAKRALLVVQGLLDALNPRTWRRHAQGGGD
jgi:phytoene synthase